MESGPGVGGLGSARVGVGDVGAGSGGGWCGRTPGRGQGGSGSRASDATAGSGRGGTGWAAAATHPAVAPGVQPPAVRRSRNLLVPPPGIWGGGRTRALPPRPGEVGCLPRSEVARGHLPRGSPSPFQPSPPKAHHFPAGFGPCLGSRHDIFW